MITKILTAKKKTIVPMKRTTAETTTPTQEHSQDRTFKAQEPQEFLDKPVLGAYRVQLHREETLLEKELCRR